MSEWQPIETAPIGVECLVLHHSGRIQVRYRNRKYQSMMYPGGADIGWFTHWMPLPPSPPEQAND